MELLSTDRDILTWWLQQQNTLEANFSTRRPDFLIVSPPKTGSTWLARNLRCHPEVFVPELKEVKYFSSWFKWFDLEWYLAHFASGVGRMKGEVSPSYAILPAPRIRLIRSLFPDIKLIYLMREPMGRAWSHAKHNYCYREANFAGCQAELASVSDEQWQENFRDDWPLTSGDYLGQLQRWLSVFPKEQVFVGFYESIGQTPEKLLRDLFAFLGVDVDADLSSFPLRERIQPGMPADLSPALRDNLHRLLHQRTAELATFLERRLGLTPPAEWQTTLAQPASHPNFDLPAAFSAAADDIFLTRVSAREERFPSATKKVVDEYRGYRIVFYRGRLYALSDTLGDVWPAQLTEAAVSEYLKKGQCLISSTLPGVKECVDQHVYEQSRARLAELAPLRSELLEARERLARLEVAVAEYALSLRKMEADMRSFSPWFYIVNRFLRPAWRRLRTAYRTVASKTKRARMAIGDGPSAGNTLQRAAAKVSDIQPTFVDF